MLNLCAEGITYASCTTLVPETEELVIRVPNVSNTMNCDYHKILMEKPNTYPILKSLIVSLAAFGAQTFKLKIGSIDFSGLSAKFR